MGQNTFGAYYQQMLGNLGSLSGATSQTPAGGAQAQTQSANMAYNAQNQNAQSGLGLVGMALGGANSAGLFSGFGGMMGGGGGSFAGGASEAGGAYSTDYMTA